MFNPANEDNEDDLKPGGQVQSGEVPFRTENHHLGASSKTLSSATYTDSTWVLIVLPHYGYTHYSNADITAV